jgi:Uma2 family endonuclease
MAFVLDPAYLPAVLTCQPMSDEEFAALCAEHPDVRLEMTAEGELIVMPPTFSITGLQNSEILGQLRQWSLGHGRGVTADSSTGFVLGNGARRSPDASWISRARLEGLTPDELTGFWHLCPDFVIELRSPSDRLRTIHEKMEEYLANGASLGWLIDPAARSITVFRPNAGPETVLAMDAFTADGPVAGFTLELARVWDPLGNRR